MKSKIKISACIITYNHEAYIKDCLDGAISQILNCEYEIVIGEDFSSDATLEICKEYADKYPNLIRLLPREKNLGMIGNWIQTLKDCKGKYIALCEGDDYWTDPLKLQKQVDFLEENDDVSFTFHSVGIHDLINKIKFSEIPAGNRYYNINELLLTKVAHTCSFVFQKTFLDIKVFDNKNIFGGDLVLALSLSEKGQVYGFEECMSNYRKHIGGVSNSELVRLGNNHYKRFVKQFIFIKKQFKTLNRKAINLKIVDNCLTVANYYYKERNILAIKYVLIAIYYKPELIIRGIKKIISV